MGTDERFKSGEGRSKSSKPLQDSWKSMYIGWGCGDPNTDKSGAPLVLPAPFITFKSEKDFIASHAMTDYNSERVERPDEQRLLVKRKSGYYYQTIVRERNFGKLFEKDLVDLAEENDEYSEAISESSKIPVGVVATEVHQWVCIRIDKLNESDPKALIHLWGFLQPRGFNGEAPMSLSEYNPFSGAAVQKDEEDHLGTSVSDARRSGWAEYKIDCESQTAVRLTWNAEGGKSEENVKSEDIVFYERWRFEEKAVNGKKVKVPKNHLGDVVKIKIIIRNELTDGDRFANEAKREKREKIFKELNPEKDFRPQDVPQDPESMVEIGCWLKVWVRNDRIPWRIEPGDDRSNYVVQSMDSQDIGEGIYGDTSKRLRVDSPFPWRNHGFLRGRIADGRSISADKLPKTSDLVPLYIALVTEEGKKHVEDLVSYLTAPPENDKSTFKQLASGAVSFLGNSFISLIVFYAMKEYLRRQNDTVPDSTTTSAIFEEEKKKRIQARLKFIQSMLRFFDVPNKFASFGVSGFRATTLDALRNEAKNRPGLFNLYSTIFSTQLDMALSLHPSLMDDLVADSLQARSEALERFLGRTHQQPNAADRKGPLENLKEKFLEFPKGELKVGIIDISYTLAAYSKTEYFPKPFGMLLAPFGIPVGFASVKFSRQASLDLNLQVYWNANSFGLGFGFSIGENSGLRLGVEVCALWAVLARPDYIPAGSRPRSTQNNPGPGYSARTAAREVRRIGNRAESGQMATSSEIQESVLLKLVQNLQGAMNASVTIDFGLTAAGHVGWRFNYDQLKKEVQFQFKALEEKDLKFELKGDLTFEIKLGFLTWAYKIAEIDLARLTPEQFQVPLTGVFGGGKVDFGPAFTYKMIEEVGENLYLFVGTEDDDHYGVSGLFGRAASAALKLNNEHEFIHFGETRKLYLKFAGNEVPKIDFNVYRSEGLKAIPEKTPSFMGWPFQSESKAAFVEGKDANGRLARRLEYNMLLSTKKLGEEYLNATLELKSKPEQTCYQAVRLARSLIQDEYVPVLPEAVLFSKGRKLDRDILLLKSPKISKSEGRVEQNPVLGRSLVVHLTILNFDDEGLWVRLKRRNNGQKGAAIKSNNRDWNFVYIDGRAINSHVSEGVIKLPFLSYGLSQGQQFSFDLALMPDDECVLAGGDSSIAIFTA